MKQTGTVVERHEATIFVQLHVDPACFSRRGTKFCAPTSSSCTACGVHSTQSTNPIVQLTISPSAEISVGDDVIFDVSNTTFLYINLLIYGLPVVVLCIGYALGIRLNSVIKAAADVSGMLTAFAAVILYFLCIWFITKKSKDTYRIVDVRKKKL